MSRRLDFNCDLGEGCAGEAAILPFISSASLACGLHAGDPVSLRNSIEACLAHGVAIGAHPSWDDRAGFGRHERQHTPADARAVVLFQLGALAALVHDAGARLAHVKPHGALYNQAAKDPELAQAIAQAVYDFDPSLLLYGLAGSALTAAGAAAGLAVVHEVFAERRYEADGRLTPRSQPDACIDDPAQAIAQVRTMLHEGVVIARTGQRVPIRADSLCLHGDRADAPAFAQALRAALDADGVRVGAPGLPA